MENQFRKALESGHRLFGTHVNLTDYRVCEMLGGVGFDYLWVDMEHIATSFSDMERHLIAAKAAGTPCVVRVTWNDIPHIKRVLEAGPDAIVVPMVNSVKEAQRAIDTCIYPPEGKRGFGPCRAVRYGLDSVKDYIDQGSKQLVRILQVETKDAVDAMEEVAKIPYVDGFLIGPMDLSGSVGELNHAVDGKKTNRLVDLAIAKAHAAGPRARIRPPSWHTGWKRAWISYRPAPICGASSAARKGCWAICGACRRSIRASSGGRANERNQYQTQAQRHAEILA